MERRSRSQRDTSARRDRARRGTAHQELADQDGTAGQIAPVPLRLRADRHPGREPHRRALLHRPIPRSRAGRSPVPVQPGLLCARRARPSRRLPKSCGAARPAAAGNAATAQVRRRIRAPRPHREELFRPDGRGAAAALRGLPRACCSPDRAGATPTPDPGRVRAADDAARVHAHGLRYTRHPRSGLPHQSEARGARRHSGRPPRRAGSQDHRVLRVGAHARAGARARSRDGRGDGVAYGVGAAAASARRDHAIQAGSGLPAVSVHRQRQRGAQSAGGERGGERRPAVEPRQARAAYRPRVAQEPDALGDRHQSRLRGFDRASNPASARAEAGIGRWCARRARRPFSSQDAVGSRGHDRADAGVDANDIRATHRLRGGSARGGAAASPRRARAADRGAHRLGRSDARSCRARRGWRDARGRGEAARGPGRRGTDCRGD